MNSANISGWRRSSFWIFAAAVSAAILFTRLELSFDLSAFLPGETTLQHDILVEQIRKGPASRLMIIGIGGAPAEELAEHSDTLKQELAASPLFANVLNGEFPEDTAEIPEPVASHVLLMRDIDYSAASLHDAVQSRLRDLAFGGGTSFLQLVASDPFLATLDVVGDLAPVDTAGDLWFAENGTAVLMAETRAAAIDIEAQAAAVTAIRTAFKQVPGSSALHFDVTGVGAFSVELQRTIRAEAMKRTILATAAVLFVLLIAFRNLRFLLLASLPIGAGFLAGLTLVTLLFDKVHGITLAFGFTLLGVAIDYPLHLFSHSLHDSGQRAIGRIWPTMRIGVISTAVAYLALAFSGSEGLAQLGLFTAGGVTVAVLVTRTWLPALMVNRESGANPTAGGDAAPTLRYVIAAAVLLMALVPIWRSVENGIWDDNLSSLSPVPAERLQADQALRSATVTPDLRYQLVLHDESLDALLEKTEAVEGLLSEAAVDGLLQNWQSVTQVLPSLATQERRRNAIPPGNVVETALDEAIAGTPFRSDAFSPFVAATSVARTLPPLVPDDFADTPLRAWLESHLIQVGGEWAALVSLVAPRAEELGHRVAAWEIDAELVDLQESSLSLMQNYRGSAIRTLLVAAFLIVAILWYAYRRITQAMWISLTVAAALAVTVAVVATAHGGLTVIHLVALLLVLGLGLDYSLFLSRNESQQERRATDRGVLACAASTTLAFGILAGSTIPVLKFLGLTVATGSAASYLIAWAGARVRAAKTSVARPAN